MIFVVTQKKRGKLLHTIRLCFNFNIQHCRRRCCCIVDGSLAFETSWRKKLLSEVRVESTLELERTTKIAIWFNFKSGAHKPSARRDDELELISFFSIRSSIYTENRHNESSRSAVCHWSCRKHQISLSVWRVKVNFRTFPRVGARWSGRNHNISMSRRDSR